MSEDFYRILQVDPRAEPEVIEAAYRKLAAKYHPDVNPSPDAADQMKRINRARDVLSNPEARQRYDLERRVSINPFTGIGGSAGSTGAPGPEPTLAQRLITMLIPWFIGTLVMGVLFEVLPRFKQYSVVLILLGVVLWFMWLRPLWLKHQRESKSRGE